MKAKAGGMDTKKLVFLKLIYIFVTRWHGYGECRKAQMILIR